MMMEFIPVRIYDHVQPAGYRLLVDRLWPRGVSKVNAALDGWAKTIAPSNDLREWFGHEPDKFPEFTQRYLAELDENPAVAEVIRTLQAANAPTVLLLFGAKDTSHNNAVVLADYLKAKVK
ncbi:DUF488 domain-containing protein [Lacticaseibacillus mingshuiensis]|uniref:DUF488 domain-containing protein n=2 Tax=Lacticaseibacillus mingshuiensis TaxID=2799574 RepID=A0ABW4CE72_9LACO